MDDIHEAAAAPHYWGIGIRLVGSTQMRVGFVSYKSQCYTQNMANLLWELQWSLTESGINRTQFDPSRGLQGAHRMGVNTKWEREREPVSHPDREPCYWLLLYSDQYRCIAGRLSGLQSYCSFNTFNTTVLFYQLSTTLHYHDVNTTMIYI